MDDEQTKTLLDMRLAKYPDHQCLMQELTFKNENLIKAEARNVRLEKTLRMCLEYEEMSMCGDPVCGSCSMSKSCNTFLLVTKIREVLGDDPITPGM